MLTMPVINSRAGATPQPQSPKVPRLHVSDNVPGSKVTLTSAQFHLPSRLSTLASLSQKERSV